MLAVASAAILTFRPRPGEEGASRPPARDVRPIEVRPQEGASIGHPQASDPAGQIRALLERSEYEEIKVLLADPGNASDPALLALLRDWARKALVESRSMEPVLAILGEIKSRESLDLLIEMFREFTMERPDCTGAFVDALQDVEDPRVGQIALERYSQMKEENDTAAVRMVLPLVVKHGGTAGTEVILERLRTCVGSEQYEALDAMRYSNDPQVLRAGLDWLHDTTAENDEIANGLVEAFGSDALNAMFSLLDDRGASREATRLAVRTLARHVGQESVDDLLHAASQSPHPEVGLFVADQLTRRRNLRFSPEQLDTFRRTVIGAIAPYSTREHALTIVAENPTFQSPEVLEVLEKLLANEQYASQRPSIRNALVKVKAGLAKASGR
jgi:hypothetical protein